MRLPVGLLTSAVITSLVALPLAALPGASADAVAGSVARLASPAASRAQSGKPTTSACYNLTAKQLSNKSSYAKPVRCTRPHTAVIAGVPNLPPRLSYLSSDSSVRAGSIQVCAAPFAKRVGGQFTQRATTRFALNIFRPTPAQIRAGARWVRCDVILVRGTKVSPLPTTKKPFLKKGVTNLIRRCGTRSSSYVPCRTSHGYRAAGAFRVKRKAYPDAKQFQDLINRGCPRFLKQASGYATIRDRLTWNTGDRTITCFKQTKS